MMPVTIKQHLMLLIVIVIHVHEVLQEFYSGPNDLF
jgi:hypothetical protein